MAATMPDEGSRRRKMVVVHAVLLGLVALGIFVGFIWMNAGGIR